MRLVGNPHRRQLTRPQQTGKLLRIAPVRLYPVARSAWDQRRRHHRATMAERRQLPVEPAAGRPRLIAKVKPPVALLQFGNKSAHALGVGADLAEIPHLPVTAFFRNRYRMPHLGHVQSDENLVILPHGSSSCAEDRPAHRGQPSFTRAA